MTGFSKSQDVEQKGLGSGREGRASLSNFPPYPEYQDSEIKWLGDMPAHWRVKRLRHVLEFNPGKRELRALPGDTIVSFLPMEAVGEDGSLDLSEKRPLSDVLEGYTPLKEADVTFAKITPCFENGKGAIMRGLHNGIGFGTTELTVLRAIRRQIIPDYLYRIISAQPFRELGESEMYGAGGQKRVPDNFVRDFCVAIPPRNEQEKIAAFLDHETARIDALIEEQKRLIELLQEKRQAVISHAVTKGLDPDVPMKDSGVAWLGDIPEHWDKTKIKFLGNVKIGLNYSPDDVTDESSGLLVLRASNIYKGGLVFEDTVYVNKEKAKLRTVKEGDLIICSRSGSRDLIGKCALVDKDSNGVSFGAFMMSFESSMNDYLYYVLSSGLFKWQAGAFATSTINQLTNSEFENMLIPLPPRREREKVVEILEKEIASVDKLLSYSDKMVWILRERRSALISAAVTGKIDVRNWQPQGEMEQPDYAMTAEESASYGVSP